MPAPAPYLSFPGTARAALEFYAGVFGGEVIINTFEQFSRTDGPADAIAHGMLRGPVVLFASDAGEGETSLHVEGVLFSLLGRDEPAVLHRWFDGLAEGGEVLDPLAEKPWGASDGQVRDPFGLTWLIGYEPSGAS